MIKEPQFWTSREVADYLRIQVKVLHNKVEKKEIKAKRFGRNLRFDPKYIKSLIK